jgi:hypothetical protein
VSNKPNRKRKKPKVRTFRHLPDAMAYLPEVTGAKPGQVLSLSPGDPDDPERAGERRSVDNAYGHHEQQERKARRRVGKQDRSGARVADVKVEDDA